ncbi:hypothetical protein MPAN_005960 [Mariniplasma anaerobium]|uniref:Macro domain-containing protein n=1 Tax=Mariniplasma anaerobium TaxID=2735436 RepID=A0A7U9TGK6_9MOLU|nr:hypothetical protein MPAN_005960 [Mariniplasma anaerobium]
MSFQIIRRDITIIKVDAIVNSVNDNIAIGMVLILQFTKLKLGSFCSSRPFMI